VDWWLQLHDRQVFIEQAVAASHVHLMSERQTGHRVLQGEAAGHVWARIDGPLVLQQMPGVIKLLLGFYNK